MDETRDKKEQGREPQLSPTGDSANLDPWRNPDATPFIRIENLSKQFDGVTVVDSVNLDIYKGELFAVLGSSGCGKTTLLRMLAGFEVPSSGRIIIDEIDMTSLPPYERPVNMMFQSYAVFPHMTVENNIAYGLKKEGAPKSEIRDRVDEMLSLVQLTEFRSRKPHQLSGGQQQRIALARALVKRPKVLLLDEPLAALDKKLRERTQFELMNIQDQLGITFVVVTHDQEEAMTLATRIAVMDEGRFIQTGTPNQVYEYPSNRVVADFFGTINMFEGVVSSIEQNRLLIQTADSGVLKANLIDGLKAGDRVWVAVRPEKIAISKEPVQADRTVCIKGRVWDLGYYGNRSIYRVKTDTDTVIQVSAQNQMRSTKRVVDWEDEVYVSWDLESSIVLKE
jgi:putrescine transport system ATP-binding protein